MQIALRHGRVVLAVAVAAFSLPACAKDSDDDKQKRDVDKRAEGYEAYLPKNTVELDNYNEAQRLYDSPSTIIWCSTKATAGNVCSVRNAARGDASPILVEAPAFAYEATYRRIKATYDRRMSNLFEARAGQRPAPPVGPRRSSQTRPHPRGRATQDVPVKAPSRYWADPRDMKQL